MTDRRKDNIFPIRPARIVAEHAINPHRSGMAPDSVLARILSSDARIDALASASIDEMHADMAEEDALALRADRPDQGDVRGASTGELYPAVIAVVEVYGAPERSEYPHDALESRLRYRAYDLLLDGAEERFATWEDAEEVARALLADANMRRAWSARDLTE